ncbi:MAG: lipid-A-disaccharide synthase N-terminal domain-containing protein, partial [Verrucomicrobia bacterium]|nr:lipid-A-disaccharide synthase N-terminal domain-containing protein [Verrucomicrobiota bacterium]
VQWYCTEKQKRVVVPAAFWWLSLLGATLLFAYALFYRRDSVFIFAYAFTWIPYVRNLVIHYRTEGRRPACPHCGARLPRLTPYCPECGRRLEAARSGGKAG